MELLYRAIDGLVVERGAAEELPDPTVTGDSGVLFVVLVDDDYDALGVGEGALTLSVGIAGAARGEAAGGLRAPARDAAVIPDGGVRGDRSGEPADQFVAARCVAGGSSAVGCRAAALPPLVAPRSPGGRSPRWDMSC